MELAIEATVQLIPVEAIRPDPNNVRRIKPSHDDEMIFYRSIAEVGVRIPIIVRPDPEADGQFVIVAGERRWAASKTANMAVVPAIVRDLSDGAALTDQVGENAVRSDMHPVDQWRSIARLMERGYNITTAAAIMGLPERQGKRLQKLAAVHSDILDALASDPEMPDWEDVGIIASAPLDVQIEAFKRYGDDGNWYSVVQGCQVSRIPRDRAKFDVEASGILFEEDLFGEPTDPDRWTTTDVAGFVKAQQAAIEALAAESKGRTVSVDSSRGELPAGWARDYAPMPQRWKKDDPRKVFVYVSQTGYRTGEVYEVLAKPIAADAPVQREATPAPRDPITKAGHDMLAKAKRQAVRDGLLDGQMPRPEMASLVAMLLLALAGNNVTVHGDPDNHWTSTSFADFLPELVDENGLIHRDLATPGGRDKLSRLLAEAVARMVVFESPKATTNSGPVAEWIGAALSAHAFMPRMDTPDFLATCSLSLLKDAAKAHGVTGKGGKELKEKLAGHAEHFNPAQFGAPGPKTLGSNPDPVAATSEAPDFSTDDETESDGDADD